MCVRLLQFWAQAGAQLAAISNGCRETTALHASPAITQDREDLAAASHKYPRYPELIVNALRTGSVSSVMFGRVENSQILAS